MKTIRIGKHSANDYVVSDDTVSRYHAQMTVTDSGEVYIKDLGSTNGTFVDGKKILSDTKLVAGNVVRLGNKVINWQEISNQTNPNKTKITNSAYSNGINGSKRFLIGREEQCQIRFTQSEVSGRHATLELNTNNEPQITDLNSTNGTFVNGHRIFAATILHKGDVVLLANKFPLMWEQYCPTSNNQNNKKKTLYTTAIIAACIASLIIIGGGLYFYLINKPWSPEKVYSTYKHSVVWIAAQVHYAPSYKGQPLSEITYNEAFDIYNVDEDGDVIHGLTGWTGSGAFVSQDGLIVTNRHVASMQADEDRKNKEKIKKQIKKDLNVVYAQLYEAAVQTRNKQKRKLYTTIMNNLEDVYNHDEDIELTFVYDFLGVAYNDTHVSNILKDLHPCTFIRNHPDEKVDAALIQLNSKRTPDDARIVDLQHISEPKNHKLGCKVYTIGFPLGATLASTDIGIEANNQSGEITQDKGDIIYGHNMNINHGASGSPVFDSKGRFAGIVNSGAIVGGLLPLGYNNAIRPEKVAELMK